MVLVLYIYEGLGGGLMRIIITALEFIFSFNINSHPATLNQPDLMSRDLRF